MSDLDNQPKHGDLLVKLVRDFRARGYKFKGYMRDKRGKYACILHTPYKRLPFALVAKGSTVMESRIDGEVVSIQQELVDTWKGPIVLALLAEGMNVCTFRVFDSKTIKGHVLWGNIRFQSNMYNFKFDLGVTWVVGRDPLMQAWRKVKLKSKQFLDAYSY